MDRWLVTVTSINTILESLDTRSLDIIQLNSVFSTLARLETEISLHTEAVLSGEYTEIKEVWHHFLIRSPDRGAAKTSVSSTTTVSHW